MGERLTCRVEVGGERLDVYLAQLDEVPSRAYAKRLIDDGHVTINGQSPGKAGVRLKAGDVVEVHLPPPQASELEPQAIPLDIVYEDAHLLVLNKPAGMVVHPAPGHSSGTLVNALLHRYPDLPGIGGVKRPGIVHRLDKETSGLMVVAKTTEALSALVRAMKARRITRRYLALVHGVVKADQGQIDAPIGRHPVKRQQMAVVEGGRPALDPLSRLGTVRRGDVSRGGTGDGADPSDPRPYGVYRPSRLGRRAIRQKRWAGIPQRSRAARCRAGLRPSADQCASSL